MKVTSGYRVGQLVVERSTDQRRGGYCVWVCRCDCGNEILLDTRYLQRGTITNCGCIPSVRPGTRNVCGQRFGKLVALEQTDERSRGTALWRCQCDCGNEAVVSLKQLVGGYVKSCGCLSRPPLKQYIGKRFGRLVVEQYAGKEKGRHMWSCRCDCGNVVKVCQTNLQTGKTQSCGCLNRERVREAQGLTQGTSVKQLEYYQSHLSAYNKSGYNGVYQDAKTKKWVAQISIGGKNRNLGAFNDKQSAIEARRKKDNDIRSFLDQFYGDHPEWKKPQEIDAKRGDGGIQHGFDLLNL